MFPLRKKTGAGGLGQRTLFKLIPGSRSRRRTRFCGTPQNGGKQTSQSTPSWIGQYWPACAASLPWPVGIASEAQAFDLAYQACTGVGTKFLCVCRSTKQLCIARASLSRPESHEADPSNPRCGCNSMASLKLIVNCWMGHPSNNVLSVHHGPAYAHAPVNIRIPTPSVTARHHFSNR